MSIIIVGVGPAEFDGEIMALQTEMVSKQEYDMWCNYSLVDVTAMEELDGDEVRVSSRGRVAERDIVQVHNVTYSGLLLLLLFFKVR